MDGRSKGNTLSNRATHTAPSGLGGVFNVVVLAVQGSQSQVRTVGYERDWNGKTFWCDSSEVKLIIFKTKSNERGAADVV